MGCIERVTERPYICLPLSVVFSKKLRLLVDASRHLNPFIMDRKVKLETLEQSEKLVQLNDYQMITDLDSGYWHVPLFEGHRQFAGVHYVHSDGSITYWRWKVLFLGSKDAVFIFTKLLIPHKTYLRSHGVRMSLFLDDQRVLGDSKERCLKDNNFALETLNNAGWTASVSKSSVEPVQSIKFLGLVTSTTDLKYFVPDDKQTSICELLIKVLNSSKLHIKVLARLLGKLQFCVKAMGPSVRLLCRSSHHIISKAKTWNSFIIISDLARKELSYLLENFSNLNGHPLRPSLSAICIDISISSDASDLGHCVYKVSEDRTILSKRLFSAEEAIKSSTYRELVAFRDFYLSDKAKEFMHCNIIHYTDNNNCAIILSIGSRNPILQPIVLDIFLAWKQLNLCVTVTHLSRSDPIIQYADFESRNFDIHDYSLDFDNFLFINSYFGPFVIDCFASKENKKCSLYYSKFVDPLALGCNFFVQKIPFVKLFVFPPVSLIIPSILHLNYFNSFGVFILPLWKSSIFWTFICNDGIHFNNFVTYFLKFSPNFVKGEHVINDTFSGVKKFDSLLLSFNFDCENPFISNVSKDFCSLGSCILCT